MKPESTFGEFSLWTQGNPTKAQKFVVWADPHTDTQTVILYCRTAKQAANYRDYLNAVIAGHITIPRHRNQWR